MEIFSRVLDNLGRGMENVWIVLRLVDLYKPCPRPERSFFRRGNYRFQLGRGLSCVKIGNVIQQRYLNGCF